MSKSNLPVPYEQARPGVIYLLTSPTGRHYVGQSVDFTRRMRTYHNGGSESQTALHRAIKKHGFGSFEAVPIVTAPKCCLTLLEGALINAFRSTTPNGYNLGAAGPSPGSPEWRRNLKATHRTPEYRAAQSERQRKAWSDPEYRAMRGTMSAAAWQDPEYREKMMAIVQESWADPERRTKQVAAMTGNQNGLSSRFGLSTNRLKANELAGQKRLFD